MFNSYFFGEIEPNTDKLSGENCMKHTQEFSSSPNQQTNLEEEVKSSIDSSEDRKHSDADSTKTCAQTMNSLDQNFKSTQKFCVNISKRSPRRSSIKTISTDDYTASNYSLPIEKTTKSDLSSCLQYDSTSEDTRIGYIARLAIKVLDHESPIFKHEWDELCPTERIILRVYLEGIYNVNFQFSGDDALLCQINDSGIHLTKAKRNEEKLKKIMKKVNRMMVTTFVSINNLEKMGADQLTDIIFGAYFGNQNLNKIEDQDIPNIFDQHQAFTQKAFKLIASNRRYTEDFETIMRSTYIPEFIRSRHIKVCKNIAVIKRKVKTALKLDSGKKQDSFSISTPDIVKRAPWTLSDVISGMCLCQSIISSSQ